MFIQELLTVISNLDPGIFKGKISLNKKSIGSISSYSSNAIYYFKNAATNQASMNEIVMSTKALEKQYSTFVSTCIGLIPFHRISSGDVGSIEEYLRMFHQNLGMGGTSAGEAAADKVIRGVFSENMEVFFKVLDESESAICDRYQNSLQEDSTEINLFNHDFKPVNEMYGIDHLDSQTRYKYDKALNEAKITINKDIIKSYNTTPTDITADDLDDDKFITFSKGSIFTDADAKKANEMLPTLMKVNINFIVNETNQVITREVLIGIKVLINVVPSKSLVESFYDTIINKRKFLRFVKWVSGEEKSLADLIFGISELKNDLKTKDKEGMAWLPAYKRRKRWKALSIPFLMKSYTPNGTITITMNEINFIKSKYGIDILKDGHLRMIMQENFLLGCIILDQAEEKVYALYDGHENIQEYTYNMLEREMNTNDRMMREMYRAFSSR